MCGTLPQDNNVASSSKSGGHTSKEASLEAALHVRYRHQQHCMICELFFVSDLCFRVTQQLVARVEAMQKLQEAFDNITRLTLDVKKCNRDLVKCGVHLSVIRFCMW